ncbi:MAG TPA: sugar ABC transporter ATP-binding protein [Burkholderiaceae bacterium]
MTLLQTHGLSKHYPGVLALDAVDFDLRRGEVHVLFGENGAGKSTLISLLAGVSPPTAGSIELNGGTVRLRSVREARLHGISAVFQEFSLVPTLSVVENLFLGEELRRGRLLDRSAMARGAERVLAELQFDIDSSRTVAGLSRAEQQMVEIAKGLRAQASVLILDEPTASLTDKETLRLFELVRRLKAQGVGIVYISHRMQEIDEIADRITVLRDGRKVDTVPAQGTPHDRLIEMMTGRDVEQIYPHIEARPGETVLQVDRLSTASGGRDASITVRRGEVVGLAGLVGSGKSELLRAIYGLDRITGGQVTFLGQDITGASPARLLRRGLFYLPPDRKAEGLVLCFSSNDNIALPILGSRLRGRFGLLNGTERERATREAGARVELTPQNASKAVGLLSGGNQQKVLFAKGLTEAAALYVFDEPTVGVDVGTRSALYRLIKDLCEQGAGVVLISSDLPEVLHLSHRAYVMCAGQIGGELQGDAITESALLSLFFQRSPKAAV